MRWLPIRLGEQDETVAVHVPCPVVDLIWLTTGLASSDSGNHLHRLLRLNPSMLLFTLSNFLADEGAPPETAEELVRWSQQNLLEVIRAAEIRHDLELNRSFSEQGFHSDFELFLRARSNRRLRKSLHRFLRRFSALDKSTSKTIVKRLVGKGLRAEQFDCKKVRRKKTLNATTRLWSTEFPGEVDIEGLFTLTQSGLESCASFQTRLTEEKLASMKQLAYGASHEINNPLANIATRAQTMLATETDPEKRHKLSVIYEQAMRAHEMISDMMLFAHPPAISRQHVSVRLLLSRIMNELKPLLATIPTGELRVSIGEGVDQAQLDPTQFSVAIKCLVQNSVEALRGSNQRSPQLEVRVERTNSSEIQFSIWDNGPGIEPEVARHMFDPFYSGREAGRGLGFGLSKVWTIARLHGGSLRYDDETNNGTQFVLALPIDSSTIQSGTASVLTICNGTADAEEEAA